MAFEFGIATDLEINKATISFLVVMFFLVGFEFVTGVLEFSLHHSPIYLKLIQKIYRELMSVGVMR
jgi:hypothetical protein